MPENRLDVILRAQTDQFKRDLKEGSDAATDFAKDVSDSLEKSARGTENLEEGLEKIEEALRRTADRAAKAAEKEARANKEREREIRDVAEGYRDAAAALRELAAPLDALNARFEKANEEARSLDRGLKIAFANPQDLQKYSKVVKSLRDEFRGLVDTEQLVQATKRMEILGAASEKNLQRLTKAAILAGESVDDLADDFGEALADVNSGVVDPAIFDTLRAKIGAGTKELQKYGAVLDSNDKLLTRNRDELKKAQDALLAYIDTNERFNGIAERAADNQSRLANETAKLTDAIGEQVAEFKELSAGALLPLVERLNKTSDTFKGVVGVGAQVGSTMASVGAQTLEVAAFAKILGLDLVALAGKGKALVGTLTAVSGATAAMTAGLALGAAGLVAITKTAYDYSKALEEAAKSADQLAETQARIIQQRKDVTSLIGKSVDAILTEAKALKTSRDAQELLSAAIVAKIIERQKLEDEGRKEAAQRVDLDIRQLSRERAEYSKLSNAIEANAKRQADAERERYQASLEAFRNWKLEVSRGVFDGEKAALKDLDSIIGGLSGDALQEAVAERKKLRATILDDEVAALKARVEAEGLSAKQSDRILDGLLAKYGAGAEAKKKIETDFDAFQEGIQKKAAARAQKFADQEVALRQRSLNLQKSEVDSAVSNLERRLERGEDVTDQLKAQLEKRTELLKSLADEAAAVAKVNAERQAAAEKELDPKRAEQIERQLGQQKEQIAKENAQKKLEFDEAAAQQARTLDEDSARRSIAHEERLASVQRKRAAELRAVELESFNIRRQQLEYEASLNKNVGTQLKALAEEERKAAERTAKDRLAAVAKEVELKLKAANVGATEERKQLNFQEAQLEIISAAREARAGLRDVFVQDTATLRAQTEEMAKQLELLREQGKEAGKSRFKGGDVFDISDLNERIGFNRPEPSAGRTEAELERQIRRNLAELGNRENLFDIRNPGVTQQPQVSTAGAEQVVAGFEVLSGQNAQANQYLAQLVQLMSSVSAGRVGNDLSAESFRLARR